VRSAANCRSARCDAWLARRSSRSSPCAPAASTRSSIEARIDTVLSGAIAALPPQDQLILRLRFENDLKIVEIARMVDLPAKPLYRQLANIVETLRANLSRHGVEASDIDRIVGNPAITLGRALRPVGEADGGSV
jgi:DNA-directed RNA polymerase specialized sigma24 family protein